MNAEKALKWALFAYVALAFAFIFTPVIWSFIFSFNSDRFPSLPLGSFSLKWYETVLSRPEILQAAVTSLTVAICTSLLATFIGFCTAYTDFRYHFMFKQAYLALAMLPPTIPLIIMALAMLSWLAQIGLSGQVISIIISHTVLAAPFAMAVIRLRLNDMDPNLEAASWNLGASEWRAMREVVIPFAMPSIIAALCLTAAVSFDEFAVAWFVSGLNKTIPVVILEILQGNVDPQINAIGTFVFIISIALIVTAQMLMLSKGGKKEATQ
ncbi:MAG: ABC transporter permease [Alphaproteobacteria bacterium]|nr:ABC transporter permease [Alphaproteobacteria bacterium]